MSASTIDIIIRAIIILGGVGIGLWSLMVAKKLSSIHSGLYKTLYKRGAYIATSALNARQIDIEDVNKKDVDDFRTDFDDCCNQSDLISRLIPLFPLIGILGTVGGLIFEVNANRGDINALYDSLDLALYSTGIALFATIGLKLIETFGAQKWINKTEALFEDFDRVIQNSILLGKVADLNMKQNTESQQG